MAAKKTSTKSSGDKNNGRPKIPSSHTRSSRDGARPTARGGAPSAGRGGATAGAPKRGAKPVKPGAARAGATASSPRSSSRTPAGGPKRTTLAAPKRASLGETSPGGRARRPKSGVAIPAGSVASDAARDLAIAIAVAGLEKKAVGLEILDVAGKVDYADFLVVMTGRSDRQVSALSQGIEEALLQKGKRALSVEGLPHASWVLMDFGDVVVHVFQDEARSLYDIEGLWMDAKRIPVPDGENEAR